MIQLLKGCHPDCRACRHRQWSMEQSLTQKAGFLHEKLYRWKHLIASVKSPGEGERWGYRKKTTLGVQFDKNSWRWGLWRRDELLHIPDCPVHHPNLNRTIHALMASLPLYDFGLRWLVMSGRQLTLVIKAREGKPEGWPEPALTERLGMLGLEGLWLHFNPSTGKRIFGKGGWQLVWGKECSIDDNGLLYGPAAFSQLIRGLYHDALSTAGHFLRADNHTATIDLYSGTGSSMKRWSDQGSEVIGVEAVAEAAKLARHNVPSAEVLTGACRLRIPQLEQWRLKQTNTGKTLLLYANPPRTGIEAEVLQWIRQCARPERMAYLSCSPGTLSRDLTFLSENQFEVTAIIPYDFFPQTHHIETLALIRDTRKPEANAFP
ncbi:MAG TPA: hypothetical protein PKE03_11765 [Bacteroidales bacterium]|nr:hypothetical protein [Bacteroidales bacterium]